MKMYKLFKETVGDSIRGANDILYKIDIINEFSYDKFNEEDRKDKLFELLNEHQVHESVDECIQELKEGFRIFEIEVDAYTTFYERYRCDIPTLTILIGEEINIEEVFERKRIKVEQEFPYLRRFHTSDEVYNRVLDCIVAQNISERSLLMAEFGTLNIKEPLQTYIVDKLYEKGGGEEVMEAVELGRGLIKNEVSKDTLITLILGKL